MRALVTGASSGIGRDMARELDRRKIDLVLVARDEEKLKELKNSLKGKVQIISMDLSKEENCKKLHELAKDIDILINNAGFGTFGDFNKTELEKEISLINTNITAVHILTKLYLKDMMEKNKRTYIKRCFNCRIYARTSYVCILFFKGICSKIIRRNKRRTKKRKIKCKNKCALPRTSRYKF